MEYVTMASLYDLEICCIKIRITRLLTLVNIQDLMLPPFIQSGKETLLPPNGKKIPIIKLKELTMPTSSI